MKETVCIYNSGQKLTTTEYDTGLWVYDIATEMSKIGFEVTVVCNCEKITIKNECLRFIPVNLVKDILTFERFKYLINYNSLDDLSIIKRDFSLLVSNGTTDNRCHYHDAITRTSGYQYDKLLFNWYGARGFKHSPYVNKSLYSINTNKQNKMLWSSSDNVSFRFLIDLVLPKIRKIVNDFTIDVVPVNGLDISVCQDIEGVNIIEVRNKQELANKQTECKVFVYPNTGIFDNKDEFVDNFYTSAIENIQAGNVVVCSSFHGIRDILHDFYCYTGDECFDNDDVLDESRYDDYATLLSERVVEVLTEDNKRISLLGELKKSISHIGIKTTINDLILDLKKGYSRGELTGDMLKSLKTRLVYHFWIPKVKSDFYYTINNIHLACLRRFSHVFDSSVIVLSSEDLNDEYIKVVKREILSLDLRGSITIKVIENNPIYREAITFNDEIMHKLDELDGATFFAHNKGTSRYECMNNFTCGDWYDGLVKWITYMYYNNLKPIYFVKNALCQFKAVTYGTLLFKNNEQTYNEFNSSWMYFGSFQWINTKTLYDCIGRNKKGYDSSDAEAFIPSCVRYQYFTIKSFDAKLNEFDFDILGNNFVGDMGFFEEMLKYQVCFGDYDSYLKFNDEILKEVEAHE